MVQVYIIRGEIRELPDWELREVRWAFHLLRQAPGEYNSQERRAAERAANRTVASRFDELAAMHAQYCKHHEDAFLPWHRRYLALFESELRRVYEEDVARNGRPPLPSGYNQGEDWEYKLGLPFWNWSARRQRRDQRYVRDVYDIPREFAKVRVDLGRGDKGIMLNPLYNPNRNPDKYLRYQIREWRYQLPYIMARPMYSNRHGRDSFCQALEAGPHDSVHMLVGGSKPAGDMSNVHTAGWDPIFWMHHNNVDRLWLVWQSVRGSGDAPDWSRDADNTWQGVHANLPISELMREAGPKFVRDTYFTYQTHVEPDFGARPFSSDSFHTLVFPNISNYEGAYMFHMFLIKEGDEEPSDMDAIADARFKDKYIGAVSSFGRRCPCSKAQKKRKHVQNLYLEVSDKLERMLGKSIDEMPEDYKIVVVANGHNPEESKQERKADGELKEEAAAGGHDHDQGHAHHHHHAHSAKLSVNGGAVTQLPWQPNIEFRNVKSVVRRTGTYVKQLDTAEEAKAAESAAAVVLVEDRPDWEPPRLQQVFRNRGAGVKVCLIDTGIDMDHPDLKDVDVKFKDFTQDFSGQKIKAPCDRVGHGTFNAGLFVGKSTGICPEAELYVARVFTGDRVASWAAIGDALKWAMANSVHVICLPLGGETRDPAVYRAVHKALADGVIVVCAAGSDVSGRVSFPANDPSVITVAAASPDSGARDGAATATAAAGSGGKKPAVIADDETDSDEDGDDAAYDDPAAVARHNTHTAAVGGGAGGGAGAGIAAGYSTARHNDKPSTSDEEILTQTDTEAWLEQNADPILRELVRSLAVSKPDSVPEFVMQFMSKRVPKPLTAVTKRHDAKLFGSSAFHPYVDIFAPGVDVMSCARGGGMRTMSGSSVATSLVAAVAVLMCGAVNASHLSFGDRYLRSMRNCMDFLELTGIECGVDYMPREFLPATVAENCGLTDDAAPSTASGAGAGAGAGAGGVTGAMRRLDLSQVSR